ncbi:MULTISPECIES: hypothetical protein [Pseudomonas]|jgi:hypothetical protein|uniref:Uncharacterized protein n=1 Tax=Pseudomonas moraviensis R28-S TaxID=1395516 RepID=V8REY9_9PSED|nr:hypothetical protein [Pseudomonas moraviensis]ETF09839.1 hypothetical protein PMO01_11840 [Pseudomonas moraviensis R28-S]PYC06798.1 hypothetical protein DMX04_02970 [Pseudomonas koreensis]
MANLIKNGDFSAQDAHWTVSNPSDVKFVTGHCIIATPHSISQEVLTGEGGGGTFMLSARMKTLAGFAGRITVQPVPTGEPVYLNVSGGQDWTVKFEEFKTPIATLKFTVKLESNDGTFDEFGAYFADVTLSKLL